jgi:hypothetical protein
VVNDAGLTVEATLSAKTPVQLPAKAETGGEAGKMEMRVAFALRETYSAEEGCWR